MYICEHLLARLIFVTLQTEEVFDSVQHVSNYHHHISLNLAAHKDQSALFILPICL